MNIRDLLTEDVGKQDIVQQNAKEMFSKMNDIEFLYKNYQNVIGLINQKLHGNINQKLGSECIPLDINNFEQVLILQRQIKQQLYEFQKENGDDQKSIIAYNQLLGLVQQKLETLNFDAGLAYMPDFISIGLDLQYVAKDIDKVVFQHWLFFKSHFVKQKYDKPQYIMQLIDKCTNLEKLNQIELENADILKNYKSVNSLLVQYKDMQITEINKNMSALIQIIIEICYMFQPQLDQLKLFLKDREEEMRQFSNLTYDVAWKKVLYRLFQLDITKKEINLKVTDNQIMAFIASDFDPGQIANFKEGVDNVQKKIDQFNQLIKSIVFMDI